ncbi:MAG: radical SAM protein, partial [Thalassospira sp.]|nr:radical SAM protein [Thalassospira sp.]
MKNNIAHSADQPPTAIFDDGWSMAATDLNILPARGQKGRGAVSNIDGRFERHTHQAIDDGWLGTLMEDQHAPRTKTTLGIDGARSVITKNQSPDVPFDRSINPYRGCEHGCVY